MKASSKTSHKPFDASLKWLLELDPASWARLLGATEFEEVTVIDSDLSTVVVAADKVLRIKSSREWLLHTEFQSGYDSEGDWRLLEYKVLLTRREKLPVESVVVLLRPEADGPAFSGLLSCDSLLDSEPGLRFRYRVVRLWELPVETFLEGGLATLPLAPLAKVSDDQLPQVIEAMSKRVSSETPQAEQGALWASTYLLLGLRMKPNEAAELLRSISAMRESTTYQAILEEGRQEGRQEGLQKGLQTGLLQGMEVGQLEGSAREARRILLRTGRRRLGEPTRDVTSAIDAIDDVDVLEDAIDRIPDVANWKELIASLPVEAR